MHVFDITCVRVLAHLSPELFNTGQLYDSSLRGGCSCEVDIFILVLLFPGSFSVSQHRVDNFSHTAVPLSATRGRKSSRNEWSFEVTKQILFNAFWNEFNTHFLAVHKKIYLLKSIQKMTNFIIIAPSGCKSWMFKKKNWADLVAKCFELQTWADLSNPATFGALVCLCSMETNKIDKIQWQLARVTISSFRMYSAFF